MAADAGTGGSRIADRKRRLDTYTKRIVSGEQVFYLVANRDDNEVPPTHYSTADVSDDRRIVLIAAGEEH